MNGSPSPFKADTGRALLSFNGHLDRRARGDAERALNLDHSLMALQHYALGWCDKNHSLPVAVVPSGATVGRVDDATRDAQAHGSPDARPRPKKTRSMSPSTTVEAPVAVMKAPVTVSSFAHATK